VKRRSVLFEASVVLIAIQSLLASAVVGGRELSDVFRNFLQTLENHDLYFDGRVTAATTSGGR